MKAQYHWNGLDLKIVRENVFKFVNGRWIKSEIGKDKLLSMAKKSARGVCGISYGNFWRY